jgi:hypothetical protein
MSPVKSPLKQKNNYLKKPTKTMTFSMPKPIPTEKPHQTSNFRPEVRRLAWQIRVRHFNRVREEKSHSYMAEQKTVGEA